MSTRGRGTRGRNTQRECGAHRGKGRALRPRDEETLDSQINPGMTYGKSSSHISRPHDYESEVEETTLELENDPVSGTSNQDLSSEMRRRGDNLGTQIPTDPDKHPKITVVNSKFIEVDVSRNISNDIKGLYTRAYPKWLAVPDVTKNLLWENFKLRYRWDDITDIEMRKVWNENAGARLREMLYKAKQKALKDASNQLGREATALDMIGRGPSWMTPEIWDELVENNWATEDYRTKCEQARKNRMTEKDGSITKHTGGSISREAHRQRMIKELKRPVDDFELFERCQRSNRGVGDFVDKKSKRISDEYRSKQGCSDSSSLPSFNLSSWCEVAGGPSKGRLYGIGRCQSFGRTISGNSVSSPFMHERESTEKIEELSKTILDMKEEYQKLIEEGRKREEEAQRREEEARQMNENLREEIHKMIQELGHCGQQELSQKAP